MKHMKTVEVPATTRKVVARVTCDLCGAPIVERGRDVSEIEVRHKSGWSCPDGGDGKEVSADLCGPCFDGKLIPWLRSQGAEPRTETWDF